MFKLFSRRKVKWPEGSPFPRLERGQVQDLKELTASSGYEVYQQVLETTAELRAQRLLQPLSPEQYHFERGVLFAYVEMHDVVQRIINRQKELDEHGQRNEQQQPSLHWGSANFIDYWNSAK